MGKSAQILILKQALIQARIDTDHEVRLARVEEKNIAVQAAVLQATIDLDRRMLELNDVRLRFLPREVYDRENSLYRQRLEKIEKQDSREGGALWAYGTVVTFALALTALILHFVHH